MGDVEVTDISTASILDFNERAFLAVMARDSAFLLRLRLVNESSSCSLRAFTCDILQVIITAVSVMLFPDFRMYPTFGL